jgi:hypothetical protein
VREHERGVRVRRAVDDHVRSVTEGGIGFETHENTVLPSLQDVDDRANPLESNRPLVAARARPLYCDDWEVLMVIRIATFARKPDVSDEKIDAFRAWMKQQPGLRAAWHAHDGKTGKVASISVWDDMASLVAMKDRTPPGGAMGLKPDEVTIYDDVQPF